MSETIKVMCYKSKTLSDGKRPLMVRVCKDGKKKRWHRCPHRKVL